MSVTIVDKNDVLMSKSYGISGMEKKTHAVGSVSKSFTALCIMQLAEQGKLSLSDPLSLYLPSVTDASKITILQLLNHTSGLGEHQNAGNCHIVGVQGKHVYANVNYSLLGEVVEAVSGMSFEDYVTANVIKPLGMDSTFANPTEAVNKGLARGHSNWFGLKIPTSIQYSSSKNAWITVPAGYICSSSSDLGRYLQMYLRGGEGIISSDGIHSMFYDSVYVEDDIPYSYGMGWNVIKDTLSEPVIYHTGLVETGMACTYILPESGIGVSFTVNANDFLIGTDLADRVGWAVIEILTGDKH
jgi:CubicO group peptidase (beta-lactamase class C family)